MKRVISKCITAAIVSLTMFIAMGVTSPAPASEPYIGEIRMLGFNFAPRGWAFCDGQTLFISEYEALFSLLGTTFGGDGETTFALPDLRGRVAVHAGTGSGLSRIHWGEKGGKQDNILTVSQLPSHNHTAAGTIKATDTDGNRETPGGNVMASKNRNDDYSDVAAPEVTMQADSLSIVVGYTGGGQAVENRQPFLGIYHCIALTGVYPSRD